MQALVLGANGHVGSAVARELLSRGAVVRAAGRRSEPTASLQGLEIEYRSFSDDDETALRRAAEGLELVVDAAAPYRMEDLGGQPLGVAKAARRRMHRLAEAAAGAGAALAHVSSFATRPARRDPLDALQAAAARRLHPYFEAKRAMEAELLSAVGEGLRAVVVNPTYCLGPWDSKPSELCLIPQVLNRRMPAAVSHALNVVDVRDVARGLVEAFEQELWGEPIALSGHDLTISSLFARICELGGGEPPSLRAPAGAAVVAAVLGDSWLTATGRASSQGGLAALLVLQQGPMPPSRAQRRLRIVPRPLTRTLLDAIEWHRGRGQC